MKVYHYDQISKIYVGEGEAKLSPLDKQKYNKDVYLIPGYATDVEPPEELPGKERVYNVETGEWEYQDIPAVPEVTPEEAEQIQ